MCHTGHIGPLRHRAASTAPQADSITGGSTGVTSRSGGTRPPAGQGVERPALVVGQGQLGRRPEQHGHHAVVAGLPAHQAGVAVDSRRHVPDGPRDHRQWASGHLASKLARSRSVVALRLRRVATSCLAPVCRRAALASRT